MNEQFSLLIRAYIIFNDNFKYIRGEDARKKVFQLRKEIEALIYKECGVNLLSGGTENGREGN